MIARAVLFDLDGTLLDTLQDLADSSNAVLKGTGCPVHPTDAYRYFVGDGMRMLARRVLPEGRRRDTDVHLFVERMRVVYAERQTLTTRPYDGVPEMLDELATRGTALGILSNKPDEAVKSVVAQLLPDHRFTTVRGVLPGVPVKPDPTSALEAARNLGTEPDRILYLGDTATDMKTATSAGMFPVGAAWGFRDEAELRGAGARVVVAHPREVPSLVGD